MTAPFRSPYQTAYRTVLTVSKKLILDLPSAGQQWGTVIGGAIYDAVDNGSDNPADEILAAHINTQKREVKVMAEKGVSLKKTMAEAEATAFIQKVVAVSVSRGINIKLYHNQHRRMFFVNAYGLDAQRLHRAFPEDVVLCTEPDPKRPSQAGKIAVEYTRATAAKT